MFSKSNERESLYFIALLTGGMLFCLWRLGATALFDLDEGGYAEIAREMLILDEWIVPHLNFVRLLDKPPLLYWLTAFSFKVFGVSEFSARLPVALSSTGIMVLCYLLGRRFFGSLAGFLAALVFITSAGVVVFEAGRQLQPDMVFTLFLTAAMGALLLGCCEPGNRRAWFQAGYFAMALAVMTKGLVGLVFPTMTLLAYIVWTRDRALLRDALCLRGILMFLLTAVPWHLAAEWRSPGFLRFYLLDVHFLRFFNEGSIASSMNSLSLGAFWAGTALIFFPWTFFVPLVLRDTAAGISSRSRFRTEGGKEGLVPSDPDLQGAPPPPRKMTADRASRFFRISAASRWNTAADVDRMTLFLWLWVGVVLAFFSAGSFRLFYYGLPAAPALAVLSGGTWARIIQGVSPRRPRREDGLPTDFATDGASGRGHERRRLFSGPYGRRSASLPQGCAVGTRFGETGKASAEWIAVRDRAWVSAATLPLLLTAAAVLTAALMPELWRDTLGRELYGMVDPNLMGYDRGVVTTSKVVSLPSWEDLSSPARQCGIALTAVAALALAAAAARKYAWTFGFIVLSMVVLRYFSQVGTEVFEPYVSTRTLGETVAAHFQPGDRLVMDGLYEDVASVTFYSGLKISMVNGVKKDLAFGARYPEAAGTFLEEAEFLDLWNSKNRVYLLTDYPANDRPGRDAFYAGLERYYVSHSGSMKLFTNHPLNGRAAAGEGHGPGESRGAAGSGS